MEKLGSTNVHGKMSCSTSSGILLITTQAFTTIIPASSAAMFLDVENR